MIANLVENRIIDQWKRLVGVFDLKNPQNFIDTIRKMDFVDFHGISRSRITNKVFFHLIDEIARCERRDVMSAKFSDQSVSTSSVNDSDRFNFTGNSFVEI